MKLSQQQIEERIQAFQEACRKMGAKATHQRTEIFRAVISSEEHPDAQSVYKTVKEKIPEISLDTVYRNLNLLADKGFIQIAGTSGDSLRFDGNMVHHHHFTCIRCGLIRDFVSAQSKEWEVPEEACTFGRPLSLQVEVKGICLDCQEKEEKQS